MFSNLFIVNNSNNMFSNLFIVNNSNNMFSNLFIVNNSNNMFSNLFIVNNSNNMFSNLFIVNTTINILSHFDIIALISHFRTTRKQVTIMSCSNLRPTMVIMITLVCIVYEFMDLCPIIKGQLSLLNVFSEFILSFHSSCVLHLILIFELSPINNTLT